MIKLVVCLIVTVFNFKILANSNHSIETAPNVDLKQYLGRWYEVASIPQSFQKQCAKDTTADYAFGIKDRINVINSCVQSNGKMSVANGRAVVKDKKSNSKLKVTFVKLGFWIFPLGGNYWILDVSPDYRYALIGDPTLKYAWILSRTSELSHSDFDYAETKFKSLGYDTCKILTSVQTSGLSKRIPLCEYVKN